MSEFTVRWFTNIDKTPFDIVWGGKVEATVQPGQSIQLVAFQAEHSMKHLVNKLLIDSGVDAFMEQTKRAPLEAQIQAEPGSVAPPVAVAGVATGEEQEAPKAKKTLPKVQKSGKAVNDAKTASPEAEEAFSDAK